jgi:DNA repair exonuclease SbcCD nuclease subunit
MTFRFAHLADLHVGAWREPALAEAGLAAVRAAFERCIEEQVDFVVIAGDLFDATLPDMAYVREIANLLRRIREAGIPVYATYGSHDYSPTSTSAIDVLEATGLFVNLMSPEIVGEGEEAMIRPRFFVDEKTGAKLAGLSGRQRSLEREYYRSLDYAYLEAEPGFKIFVFHSAISEVLPEHERHAESMPRSYLPPGFDYNAGGHIHTKIESVLSNGCGIVVYPGTLLGHQYADLEQLARGTERGFYLITVDGTRIDPDFVKIPLPSVVYHEISADQRSIGEFTHDLEDAIGSRAHAGAVVLIRAWGTLASGEPSEIPFASARSALDAQGALCVKISRGGLHGPKQKSRERSEGSEEPHEIENRVLLAHCTTYHVEPTLDPELRDEVAISLEGEAGVRTGRQMLDAVGIEPLEGEITRTFGERVRIRAAEILPRLDLE